MIFVSVGTQKFQMDRLLEEMDRICADGGAQEDVFAQAGCCTYRPAHFESRPFLSSEEMEETIRSCTLLICHAGTGTILAGIRNGKKVIVLPRQSRFGEHVDDHQRDLAAAYEQMGLILVAWEKEDILGTIKRAGDWEPQPYVSNTEAFVKNLRGAIQVWGNNPRRPRRRSAAEFDR